MNVLVHIDPIRTMSTFDARLISDLVRQLLTECLRENDQLERVRPALAEELFHSPDALAVKNEILRVGRKLWKREYVDGNGGNISYRLAPDYVMCTPTLCSKGDLTLDDICLVNFQNEKVMGTRAQTSEILLHLEIYSAVPDARAVIHCHPPHATAYAITGLIPPGLITPEVEVFVGPLAIAPYDTPGTKAFAETILPYAKSHNTIILANHGVVCWADTVIHAEWCVEVIETYCRTLMLAAQLGTPIQRISPAKIADLLDLKRKLGMPDARFANANSAGGQRHSEIEKPLAEKPCIPTGDRPINASFDSLVASVTDLIVKFLDK